MAEAAIGTLCGPWATIDDLPEGCPCRVMESGGETPDDDTLEELLMQATEVMWHLLAFPTFGPCERTIYPCAQSGTSRVSAVARRRSFFDACGCGCGCDAVWLEGPVSDVIEVIVNGVVVAPAGYELHDGFALVRVNGSWPAGGGAVSEQRFQIIYEIGPPVPTLVRDAVVELANDLWLSRCGSRDGRLSRAVTSVNTPGVGMTFQRGEVAQAAKEAGTELAKVYQAMSTYNPTGVQLRTLVYSPDAPYRNRVIRVF